MVGVDSFLSLDLFSSLHRIIVSLKSDVSTQSYVYRRFFQYLGTYSYILTKLPSLREADLGHNTNRLPRTIA